MVFLEINIGLIVGTAIIASLLNLNARAESNDRTLSKVIASLSLSAILSGIALYISIASLFLTYLPAYYLEGPSAGGSLDLVNAVLTSLSLLFFIRSTQMLFGTAGLGLPQSQKRRKREE